MSVICILLQFLTLILFSFILFVVFLLCTFCTDRKYQRARHTGKIFTNVLCSGHICEPSVGRLFVTPGFRLFSGCCGIKLCLIDNACSNWSRIARVAKSKRCQLSSLTVCANRDPHGTDFLSASCDLSLRIQSILCAKFTQWPENKRPCVGFFNGAVPPLAGNYFYRDGV
jgi:hypothetical protein